MLKHIKQTKPNILKYMCQYCNIERTTESHFKTIEHINAVNQTFGYASKGPQLHSYVCNTCKHECTTLDKMVEHLTDNGHKLTSWIKSYTHTKPEQNKLFTCSICNINTRDISTFNKHLQSPNHQHIINDYSHQFMYTHQQYGKLCWK